MAQRPGRPATDGPTTKQVGRIVAFEDLVAGRAAPAPVAPLDALDADGGPSAPGTQGQPTEQPDGGTTSGGDAEPPRGEAGPQPGPAHAANLGIQTGRGSAGVRVADLTALGRADADSVGRKRRSAGRHDDAPEQGGAAAYGGAARRHDALDGGPGRCSVVDPGPAQRGADDRPGGAVSVIATSEPPAVLRTTKGARSAIIAAGDEPPPAGAQPAPQAASAAGRRPDPADRGGSASTGRHVRVRAAADPAAGGDGPDADPDSVARAICLRLLADRARTRQELAQALRRKGIPDDAAGAVLERFRDVGLINDDAFAEQWVRSRHTNRGLGRRALAVELRRKGVADDVATAALNGVDAAAEEVRARELVVCKLRGLRTDTDEHRAAASRRLVGMLARKGYGGGIAYRVVREALAAHGAELDELTSEPPADD